MYFEYILKHNIAYLTSKLKDSLRSTDGLKDTKPTLNTLCRLPYLNIFVTILSIRNCSDLSCNRFSSAKRKTHLNRRLTLTTLWRRDFRHQIFSRLCPRGAPEVEVILFAKQREIRANKRTRLAH